MTIFIKVNDRRAIPLLLQQMVPGTFKSVGLSEGGIGDGELMFRT